MRITRKMRRIPPIPVRSEEEIALELEMCLSEESNSCIFSMVAGSDCSCESHSIRKTVSIFKSSRCSAPPRPEGIGCINVSEIAVQEIRKP